MIPNVASAVSSGEKSLRASGRRKASPLPNSRAEIAQAGSNWSIPRATSVTSVKVPTRRIETSSMSV